MRLRSFLIVVATIGLTLGVPASGGASGPRIAVGGVGMPVWSPSGNAIAFELERSDATLDIEVLNLKTDRAIDVTRGMGRAFEPSWAPDGRRLAFSGPDPAHPQFGALYVMRADGSGRRLIAHRARQSAWSPDGKTIVYWFEDYGEPEQLRFVGADGTPHGRLVIRGDKRASYPFWSPQGTSVCFHSNGGVGPVYCSSRTGQGLHVALRGAAAVGIWSSDWRYVAYQGESASFWTARLPRGEKPVRLTTHGALLEGFANRYLTWSPDDTEIAFASSTRRDGEHASLYVIGANGARRHRVFAG